MARRLVSGAKEAMAGLRIAQTEYEKIGSDAAIRSQKERAGPDARLIWNGLPTRPYVLWGPRAEGAGGSLPTSGEG
jgi:hypothetical protein